MKNINARAYGWSTEIPGDMHAKGHLCEAAFKAHGKGGFHKVVNDVMKRPKLTEEVFRKRKFQKQNLQHIQEAVRDGRCAYGIAAVHEFKVSKEFPCDDDLKKAMRKDGNHNNILVGKFKLWSDHSRKCDESHKYHQELFCLVSCWNCRMGRGWRSLRNCMGVASANFCTARLSKLLDRSIVLGYRTLYRHFATSYTKYHTA